MALPTIVQGAEPRSATLQGQHGARLAPLSVKIWAGCEPEEALRTEESPKHRVVVLVCCHDLNQGGW